eukprot:Nitzschia sp. Nitz4//scaffold14_size191712//75431//77554//NITZ4_001717-RA/size191712-processed-gene-0.309-mRNA-1//-1//CDS//3329536909//9216//frame0
MLEVEQDYSVGDAESSYCPSEDMSKLEEPQSPTGVWDYLFPSNSYEEAFDEKSCATGCFSIMSEGNRSPPPERLVDFFCVVGPEIDSFEEFAAKPSELHIPSKLVDRYPPTRDDLTFPDELPMFCLPNGCKLTTFPPQPFISTLVLTSSSGNRLYGSVLTMYEQASLPDLCAAFWKGDCRLPRWLETTQTYFLPKCLVVLSHHAFFDVQRTFLQQMHRISQSGCSPLPLERYIANFVHDVPLPRPGATSIEWHCFSKDTKVRFQRPPTNDLPLVNFSYQPLFRTLSVSNILTIWAILLQEGRVVLQSEHVALLTPVAEALTSFLFPLTWQGLYVPVLPSSMMDLLDAPVPFLVGYVGSSSPQPEGVVVCDLDQDIVHLGTDDSNQPRFLPQLPKKLIQTLKTELEDIAHSLYLVPPCGMQGRVTSAVYGLLENVKREPYAHMVQLRNANIANTARQYILSHANHLSNSVAPLAESDFILYGDERTKYTSGDTAKRVSNQDGEGAGFFKALRRQGRALQAQTDLALSHAGMKQSTMEKNKDTIANEMFTVDDEFARSVRRCFLQFVANFLGRYKEFARNGVLRTNSFVDSHSEMSFGNRLYLKSVVETQMFERFLTESSTRRRLFDEHVLLTMGEEGVETPFLNEKANVSKVIIPAAPCSSGVRRGQAFLYKGGFPYLDHEEMVANKTLDPVSALCYLGSDVFCGGEW